MSSYRSSIDPKPLLLCDPIPFAKSRRLFLDGRSSALRTLGRFPEIDCCAPCYCCDVGPPTSDVD